MDKLKITKKEPGAITPKRVTPGSAGLDLYLIRKIEIPTQSTVVVDTGWQIELPKGHFGLIKIKSGIAINYGLTENAGVIDSDYRGNLKVALTNVSSSPVKIAKGEAVAQLLVIPCWMGEVAEVPVLSDTTRGEKGFGEASKGA